MYGIRDYVAWRGDLTFEQSPLCVVDFICFSQVVVLDLVAPKKFSVKFDKMFQLYANSGRAVTPNGIIVPFEINVLFKEMAKSKRFSSVKVTDYVYEADKVKQTQFSAMVLDVPTAKIVCFSATDDTIVGWKENFNLAENKPTYAQISSVEFLRKSLRATSKPVYVVGHSKGGNLAMYSFLNCDDKTAKKVTACYSFDGPGLDKKIFDTQRARERLSRVTSVMPAYSVIGRMFSHEEEILVVNSAKNGLYQHDCFSWEVLGSDLVLRKEGFLKESDDIDRRVKDLLSKTDEKHRASMFKSFFDFLYGGGRYFTLSELPTRRTELLYWYAGMDKEDKKVLNFVLGQLALEPAVRKMFIQTLKDMRVFKTQAEKLQTDFKNDMQTVSFEKNN